MPKDNRVIRSAIRENGEVYAEGREDELAAVLPQERLDALVESGELEGDWRSTKKAAPSETATPNAPTEKKK